jgi:hypothetical protein
MPIIDIQIPGTLFARSIGIPIRKKPYNTFMYDNKINNMEI